MRARAFHPRAGARAALAGARLAQGFVHRWRIGIAVPSRRAPYGLTARLRRMPRPTPPDSSAAPPLARAFLALGDSGEPVSAVSRSPAVVVASLVAIAVLALSAPVAWATASTHKDQPTATPASKSGLPTPDDGGDGGT